MITTYHNISFGTQTVPEQIPVVQGDTGREIVFILTDFTIPEGATATYYVQKPSGEAVYNSATISENNIIVALTAQSIIEVGENDMQVRVILDEDIVTSFRAILMVRPFLGIGAVESSTEINIFDQAVEAAKEEINATIESAETALDEAVEEAIIEVHENALAFYVTDEASGAIATFPDGADLVPVKALTVEIEPVQSGSGDPSPTNVRPISGWSEAKVTRTGVNVWDEEWEVGAINGTTGQPSDASTVIRSKNYCGCVGGTTYYFKSPETAYIFFYDTNKGYIENIWRTANATFTTPANAAYFKLQLIPNYGTTYNHDVSINYPSTDHDYHSGANNETYTIDLDGTRYGGTLDVSSGVLTVTMGKVDLGDLTWTADSGNRFSATNQMPNALINADFTTPRNAICTMYKWTRGDNLFSNNDPGFSYYVEGGYNRLFVKDTTYSDAASFKTAMQNLNVQLVYELATPQTVQLTAEEVTTLLGQNCIFADCGDVNVDYRADTKLYIDKILNA